MTTEASGEIPGRRVQARYRGSAHKDCNINVKLNYKITIAFHNLKNYDSHLIIQEQRKFNFKTNVIPNGLEKYTSLIFIDSSH